MHIIPIVVGGYCVIQCHWQAFSDARSNAAINSISMNSLQMYIGDNTGVRTKVSVDFCLNLQIWGHWCEQRAKSTPSTLLA